MFAKYDSILLNVTLDTMSDIVYCPRRHCQYPVSRELNEQMANCPVCQYAFCVYCKMVYHGIEPCKVNSGITHTHTQARILLLYNNCLGVITVTIIIRVLFNS